MKDNCPCGSQKPFSDCCEALIKGTSRAPTAQALMRSRYTAYTLGDVDYIVKTTHSSKRTKLDPKGIEAWAKQSEWKGLEILKAEQGLEKDTTGMVEFVAHYAIQGETKKHHEQSLFEKDNGQWYYVSGQTKGGDTVRREAPKVGRNDPCPCGSGKKYKKCCCAG